jgi:hypothetical protein
MSLHRFAQPGVGDLRYVASLVSVRTLAAQYGIRSYALVRTPLSGRRKGGSEARVGVEMRERLELGVDI